MLFRVEYVFRDQRPVLVFARQLEPGHFALSESPQLGGARLQRKLSQPRTLTPAGQPDSTVWAFILTDAHQADLLVVGEQVEFLP